ncbi:hypothetical protein FRC12_004722 [Ceratobasidium sp. 428]|nr:hypothetical protein FRC12_004722 [Ceratobasidium sp. 428]
MKYSAVFVAILAGYVAAQGGTGTSSALPPAPTNACITQCTTQAATDAGCSGITDIECVCSNPDFQASALQCLTDNCTAAEQQQALQLEQQVCGASGSATASEPAETDTEEPASSGSATGTAPVTSSPAASSSAVTSRASASSVSRTSNAVGSASSVIASASSHAASATGSGNSAASLPVFNFAAAGVWAAVAVGGAAVAQLMF